MWWLLLACGGGKAPPEVAEPAPAVEPAPAPIEPAPVQVGPPEGEQPAGMCGGIAGLKCPDGSACLDDPADACDPKAGGRDCAGKCVPCTETGRTYLAEPQQCAMMKFRCEEGKQPFFDGCGCGCG